MPEKRLTDWVALNDAVISCRRCPRLVTWREQVASQKRRAFMDWVYWGKPVPGFGDRRARLVIIGLAPAAHGANRTGRMFTGDSSGTTLAGAMYRAGFANQSLSEHRGDGLTLIDAFLTAVARCAPPGNKPNAGELANCRVYLEAELALLSNASVVLALGKIAFDGYVRLLQESGSLSEKVAFGHGAWYPHDPGLPVLAACYHPSRQNTQTGRLTDAMMDDVFDRIRRYLEGDQAAGDVKSF
jgi:uracil-DNA glycosylase family 4